MLVVAIDGQASRLRTRLLSNERRTNHGNDKEPKGEDMDTGAVKTNSI